MSRNFESQTVMSIDGFVVAQLKSLTVRESNSKGVVKGQTPTGRPAGKFDGQTQWELDAEVYIPLDGVEPDWMKLNDAVLVKTPRGGGKPTIYTGVNWNKSDVTNSETGEATRRLSGFATNKVGP